MIYIFYGDDLKSKNAEVKKYIDGASVVRIPAIHLSLNVLVNYSEQNSLFGDQFAIILESPFSESAVVFDKDILSMMEESSVVFVILEDSLLSEEVKRYKKYAKSIEKFELIKIVKKENPFVLANLFGAKDKIGAWSTYRKLIERGGGAEPIAGILFWKIKSMILSGSDKFGEDELKNQSSELVDIYHKSHLGIFDMDIALEQFILKNL